LEEIKMAKLLLALLDEALQKNNETRDDLIFISHPIELLEEEPTLEVIQCDYLNGAYGWHIEDSVDKQDMPFAAATKNHIYHMGEYFYSDEIHCFPQGSVENLDWRNLFEQTLIDNEESIDDVLLTMKPIGDCVGITDYEPLDIPKILFIAVTHKNWYYCGKDSLYYYEMQPDEIIRCFTRDDIGASKKWSPEYSQYVSNRSKVSFLKLILIGKARDRRAKDADKDMKMEFKCFVKHPETEKKVLVTAIFEGIDCISAIDKNGINLLTLYEHQKVDR